MYQRLQKIIAGAGIASRRAAEELIVAGRVRVNGRVVDELGARADPRRDRIEVDGKRLSQEDLVYLVLHKPRGYVSTLSDPEGRPTVADLVADVPLRVFPVGRLDFATSGVLLMTNDGELTQALLHPKEKVPKTYVVKLDAEIDERRLETWRGGVKLDDGLTQPAQVRLLRHEAGKSWLEVTLFEGRNQQIRRMATATGFVAMRLARTDFAGIQATDIRPGSWRPLTVDELKALKRRYGVPRRIRPQTALGAARSEDAPKRRARTGSREDRSGRPRQGAAAQPNAEPRRPPRRAGGQAEGEGRARAGATNAKRPLPAKEARGARPARARRKPPPR